MVNWVDIRKCPIWKEVGITKCNNCDSKAKCWGEESVLPESVDAHKLLLTYALLGTIFRQQQNK